MDMKSLARDERADFAVFLEQLPPEHWGQPTLCEGWLVRDVVAHAISFEELSGPAVLWRAVKGGFVPSRINAIGLAEYSEHTPEELVALLKNHLYPQGFSAAFGGAIALVDALVHQQDIRRPLGMPRDIPEERLRPTLDFALKAPPLGAARRLKGLRLVATDIDWSSGSGAEVSGNAEALLMALAGRKGVVGELSGAGQATLAERIGG